jgi:charged multivesicular body protein 4
MQKREAFLQKKIDAELAKAKDCSKRKDKRGALMALKKKKLYEKVRATRVQTRPIRSAAQPLVGADADQRTAPGLHRTGAIAALQYGLPDGAAADDA